MVGAEVAELIFVVDVTSFTEKGFVGTTSREAKRLEIQFDDGDEGLVLTGEMAKKIRVRKGSAVSVIIEDEKTTVAQARVAAVGAKVRISSARVYYAVGREGGAIVRIRKS